LVRVLEEATLIEITRSAFKHIVTEEEGVFEILYEMITERKAYNKDKIANSQSQAKEKVTVDKESALFKSLKRILG
jgi:DNA replication initiation complex subunit (GINS family)